MKRFIFLLLFLGTSSYASVAIITAIKGDVEVVRHEKSIKAIVGFSLNVKDRVVTIGKSVAQLSFKDDTVVTLGKNSDFKISDYAFKPKVKKSRFYIAKGVFKSITGKIGKFAPKKFKIKTKTATMGIRGTTVLGQVSATDTTFACTIGAIDVISNANGDVMRVNAGQITNVALGKAPNLARNFTIYELKQLESVLDTSQFENDNATKENKEEKEDDDDDDTSTASSGNPESIGESEKYKFVKDRVEKSVKAEEERLRVENLPDIKSDPIISNDGLITWGYWLKGDADTSIFEANSIKTVWLEGVEASASRIEQLKIDSVQRVYTGSVQGIVAKKNQNNYIDSGEFVFSFDFGAAEPIGSDSFISLTQGGETWQVNNFVGKIDGNKFTINNFSSMISSDVTVNKGNINGKFFGSNAQSLGGVFTLIGSVGGEQKIAAGSLVSQ